MSTLLVGNVAQHSKLLSHKEYSKSATREPRDFRVDVLGEHMTTSNAHILHEFRSGSRWPRLLATQKSSSSC
jgi:hypothetical protein